MASVSSRIDLAPLNSTTKFNLWQVKMKSLQTSFDLEEAIQGVDKITGAFDDEKKRKEQQKAQSAEQQQAERQQQWVRFRSEQIQAAARSGKISALEDNGCSFSGRDGVLRVLRSQLALLRGVRRENLYLLEGDAIEGCAAVAKAKDDMKSWQMRLGHRCDRSLSKLCNRGLLGNCAISKRHVSFDVSSSGGGGISSGGGSLRRRLVEEESRYVGLSYATVSTERSEEIAIRKGNAVDMLRRIPSVFL